MSPEEMHRYIQFLFTRLEDIKEELRRANVTIAENASEQKRLNALVLSLTNQLNDALQKIQNLLLENESLKSSLRVFKKQRFGSSCQKGTIKKEEENGHDDDKDDFDGTAASIPPSIEVQSSDVSSSVNRNSNRVSCKGRSNSKMSADYQVLHLCDMSRIPSDAIILKKSIRKVFDSVNLIVEHDHLYFDKVAKGDLMQKAVNYMHTFWEQLFRYRNDGNYTIDNSLAERSIRPMTVERKNSLFFCSKEGAKASAIFHTIIETCKQLGLSAREYIKNFLKEVSLGRTDWQNLTPAKIYI